MDIDLFFCPHTLELLNLEFLGHSPTGLEDLLFTHQSSPYFRSLPLLDRLLALPQVKALIEYDVVEKAYMSYDFMTAIQLFREGGISARLYTDFLELYLFLQKVFQGPMAELIFIPYFQEVERLGGSILQGMYVQDAVSHDNSDRITSFIADTRRKANADKDEAARQRQHQGYSNCTSHSEP
ncbi:hypothetical protein SUGI_0770960 [Cryptomeria japonica]|nr:hypothetical protein SUGI_0770960 [Cryptomeria japonica]